MDMKWKPIAEIPEEWKDQRDIIVGVDIATQWIVRSAYWSDGEHWEMMGFDDREEATGWWSYIHSVTSEKLEDIYEPTHFLCETNRPEWQR